MAFTLTPCIFTVWAFTISHPNIATVISAAFVYATLIIWKLQYGKVLSGPFLSMLARRDREEDEY